MDREFHEQDRRGKRRKAPKPLQHKQENPVVELTPAPFQVGDLLNFLSAIFFGIHMLRTEHISRSTKKESFLAILGYESLGFHWREVRWCPLFEPIIMVMDMDRVMGLDCCISMDTCTLYWCIFQLGYAYGLSSSHKICAL
ncbi:uncharacterized protein LOC110745472 isoform X1 [Prunus avium]|uniref:Uncharacterized protein LOC110745472 isoform X1 n=1 Tax=Prunus avium TaxID=42229 RepID=A0A6P5REJ7_PRUAV|nr:uncharacterized protein LOC110745472 isoform X1 [Prunus avium]